MRSVSGGRGLHDGEVLLMGGGGGCVYEKGVCLVRGGLYDGEVVVDGRGVYEKVCLVGGVCMMGELLLMRGVYL